MRRTSKIERTRTGCQTCRSRRVKCDEQKPTCTQCSRGSRNCIWIDEQPRRLRPARRPNATACDACREKKLKCTGGSDEACQRCRSLGIECLRQRRRDGPSSAPVPTGPPQAHTSRQDDLPEGKELDELIQLYFSSVHHFGFFAFIHPLHFQRLLANGKAPRELTLIIIASALRFAAPVTTESLARADAWADGAINALLPEIHRGFGAIQLMTALLAQHYDMHRGHFTSAWLLGGSCTRMMQMMSLHTFDRSYPMDFPSRQRLSPLLSREALRRLAWSTFYLDSMIDGGRYGSQTIDERAYRIQLPCDQESFLGDDQISTEPLILGQVPTGPAKSDGLPHGSLDMSAYLLRTAAARRRALHFAFRASYQDDTVERLSDELLTLQHDLEAVFADLPRRFDHNPNNMLLHRDRRPMFILLHILRHNLFIILGRAAVQVYLRDPTKANFVHQVRRDRITRAQAVAGLVFEALEEGTVLDPHIGIQAYVAFEILLFEPRRLTTVDKSYDPGAPELVKGISDLLASIRDISYRSEFTRHLYLEAIYRLMRCGCNDILRQEDFEAIQSEHSLVGQDAAEFDFRDFRGAKLERLRNRGHPTTAAHDEVLLEDTSGQGSSDVSAAFIHVDGTHPNNPPEQPPESQPQNAPRDLRVGDFDLLSNSHGWRELLEPENVDHLFSSLNWLWAFDEWNDQMAPVTGQPSALDISGPGLQ